MKKLLKILLSQNSLRKALGYNNFFKATKFDHHLQINPGLDFHSVLVLAPHPDDDVFGCGSTIAKLKKSGAKIAVAYFCDGSGGVPEKSPEKLQQRNEKAELGENIVKDKNLVEIRKTEAKNAGQILNISEQIFFGYPDGKLAAGTSVAKAFSDLIERVKPDIIFTPSFLDNHPDHRSVNEILVNCPSTLFKADLPIWAYEVWTPIFINRIIKINPELELKQSAIAAHRSQLGSRNYDKAILALNQYRAEINGISGQAEGFFATTLEVYKKLYQNS